MRWSGQQPECQLRLKGEVIRDRRSELEESMPLALLETPFRPVASHASTDAARVYSNLSHLTNVYPGFEEWYWWTVVPSLGETRRIFIDEHLGKIRGIVVAKRSAEERKLCTVWVDRPFRGNAVGANLMTTAMDWMSCRLPLISVPASRVTEFRSFFRQHDFVQGQRLANYYRPGETEYVFNGSLPVVR